MGQAAQKKITILLVCLILSGCSAISMNPTNKICPEIVFPNEEERDIMRDYMPDFYIRYSEQQRDLYICLHGKDPM